jgi:MFS transporter, Spinster family, sphingosine-1-phosphate transporter
VAAVGSAAAVGLGSMLVSRALIGIGTAACVPVGNALLCDVFPPASKARTVSVFNVGLFAGGAAGFALGALFGFPLAFVLVALPGLLLALLVVRLDIPATRAQVGAAQVVSFAAFRRDAIAVVRIRTMRWMLVGGALMAFAAGGYVAWFADFVAQYKGMTIERATLVFGGAAVTGGLAGVLAGGVVGDWLVRRLPYGRLATITLGFGITVPFALLAVFVDAGWVFYVSIWLTMFFITWYHGPMAAVVDDVVEDRRATTGQATFLFVMHLFGTAPAPYVVGLLADGFGLRVAMLAPTAAVGLAALAFMAGWPAVEADRVAAGDGRGDRM